jgi:hypothetical protein
MKVDKEAFYRRAKVLYSAFKVSSVDTTGTVFNIITVWVI